MSHVPDQLRRHVIERAEQCCEYCRLSQRGQAATFHIDHIVPAAAGGPTTAGNLALACMSCSLRKGAREHADDPESSQSVLLDHPRRENWREHFRWKRTHVEGKTATGPAAVGLLDMNRPLIVAIRQEEALRGRHPPEQEQLSGRYVFDSSSAARWSCLAMRLSMRSITSRATS